MLKLTPRALFKVERGKSFAGGLISFLHISTGKQQQRAFLSHEQQPEVCFCIIGQWFCPIVGQFVSARVETLSIKYGDCGIKSTLSETDTLGTCSMCLS